MGLLGEALRQLEVRPVAPAIPLTTTDAAPTLGERPQVNSSDATPGFEPLAVDYSDDLAADVFAQASVDVPISADGLVAFPAAAAGRSVEQILDFARTAIQAVAGSSERNISEMPVVGDVDRSKLAKIEPPTAELAPNGRLERQSPESHTLADRLSSIPIDRAYGRLWDNLSAALAVPPPWSVATVLPDRSTDAAWMLPAAVAFAQRYAGRILLVDVSRNIGGQASLGDLFGSIPEFGLIDVLRRVVTPREAVQKTSVPRIELLSFGTDNSNSIAPVTRYADLFAELKSEYQLILIRANGPEDSQVRPIFSAVDGTLLVVELGRTERLAAETASNALYLAGARLLGCIARS